MSPQDLEAIDRDLATGRIGWTRELALSYANHVHVHPAWNTMLSAQKISMLGIQTLIMCRAFGLSVRSGILEIGAYVGGSTAALAMGLEFAGRKQMVTVDIGGAYDHPTMPSTDIHADWRKNLSSLGLEGVSTLIGGWFNDQEVIASVERLIGRNKFDLMLLDANGEVQKALNLYAHLLSDDCLLILDDYFNVQGPQEKTIVTAREINQLMAEGVIEQWVLTPSSTWIGRMIKRDALLPSKRSIVARWLRKSP